MKSIGEAIGYSGLRKHIRQYLNTRSAKDDNAQALTAMSLVKQGCDGFHKESH